MKIAVVQMDAGETDPGARKTAIERAVSRAAKQGSRIIVLPELAISGYGAGHEIVEAAGTVEGPQAAWLKKLACDADCALVAGLALQTDGKTWNSALFVAPDRGTVRYDKIHLYGDYEKSLFAPGRLLSPILSFEDLTFGLLVCFDVEFPERVRDLAHRGAEAILVPTALPKSEGGAFIAGSVLPVRAFESQVFIAYANHAGSDRRFAYQGQSCITAPDGKMLARGTADTADLLVADLDPSAYDACREQNPYLDEVKRCPGFTT